jgi:hypothetical protein
MTPGKRALRASIALLGLGAQASPALAQEADAHAVVVRLFEEAGQAADRHAYDEACPKFAKVVELEPAKLGAKLALADCYEQAGKLASAVAAYRAAGVRAAEAGDPRKKLADEKIAELSARAPRVTILVPDTLRSLPGLTVLRDGAPVDAAEWNQPVLSDPGEHTIYVGASGKKPWSGKVTVIVGATSEVVIGGLEDLAPPALPALPPPVTPEAAPTPAAARTPAAHERAVPTWAWVTGGLGIVSAGAAVAFGVDQAAAQRDFDAGCKTLPRDETACSATSTRLYRDFGLWIGLGAAGVAALTAAAVGALAPPPRRKPAAASVWIAPRGAGVGLVGSF